ncbi:cupin domain-containing protein [Azomonas macrocytogenes]|uniref:Uncharacterized protein YjlB n=1 Tax=Azomonas macrocytogenes TaxID=69962 RepID=A0A839T4D9_AZOMA|nr:cupin domain-containing protein [Azomonas macrocytogenes]MBB3103356.1 uncharacterized protein YjlB [Azomonas macrocytogenes]
MTSLSRRRFNRMLASLGLAIPGQALFAATATNPASSAPPETLLLSRNDWVPNNDHLPVLVYRGVLAANGGNPAADFEERFERTGWPPRWRASIYSFHHYHSSAHEVLGIASGSAQLMLGGPEGHTVQVSAGDVVVLPAGTGHRELSSTDDFLVVGAYPPDQRVDNCRSAPSPAALQSIRQLPFPDSDPVAGRNGPLTHLWQSA